RKPQQTTPSHDLPEAVVITRTGHPFEGQRLAVIGRRQYVDRLHLLVILPDQSRRLIPVDWTDFAASAVATDEGSGPASDALGSLDDLLHARLIIDALLRQSEQENNDATAPGLRGRAVGRRQSVGTTRPSGTRGGDRPTRTGNRKGRDRQPSGPAGEQ
ncbi:hypothetical protein G3A42_43040, partial [Paraburkholderia aspalathi]|nr:hypothetical protein [Paraburkholderia aspalathi]